MTAKKKKETLEFSAETGKILKLMIHSLYANKDIFLRELISNASDALDKLRYESLTKAELAKDGSKLQIQIKADENSRTLTISDNGIGMNKEELVDNLGTIARSGTQNFLESITGNEKSDMQLIGQFGVGFYSSFMVADKVTVISKKAGSKKAYKWESEGEGQYTVEESDEDIAQGTKITLHIKEGLDEFLDKHRISHIIKTYSDHISFPVEFTDSDGNTETLNEGSALWTKPKSEITKEQYTEFYRHIAHAADEPWLTFHNKAEGVIEYTNLLFVPTHRPFDLFHPDRETRVKLYVKRVFISEENTDLIPRYLRFVKGIVDSEDLPLNISRETLQHNNTISKIRNSIVKKILNELKKKAEKEPEKYKKFWENFGATLKEGLCEGVDANRELIFEVCRFKTTKSGDKFISLDEYVKNMQKDQEAIYYLSGESIASLMKSPQIEGFLKKDIEVILLTDSVDDFWTTVNHEYKDKAFKSITRSGIELDKEEPQKDDKKKSSKKEKAEKDNSELVSFIKNALGDKVQDVKISRKLSDSPVCLTVPEGGMDIRMEKFLIEQKQMLTSTPKILEINPNHPIVSYLSNNLQSDSANDLAELLFDEACIIEGESLKDVSAFSKRFNSFLQKALAA